MPISVVQTQKTATFGSVDPMQITFPGNVTSGNLVTVFIRGSNNDPPSSVTDGLGTTYNFDGSDTTRDPSLWCYSGIAAGTGACTVSVAFVGAGPTFAWVYGVESTGYTGSPALDVFAATLGTGVTDLVSDPFSTAVADELVFCVVSQNNFCAYSAGTDFTLLDGSIGTGGSNFGGIEYRVTSATLSSYVAHITSTVTNNYTMLIAAYKGSGSVGGGQTFTVLLVNP